MALEATHIRFALDLSEKYEVQDFTKYIPGAIYPDSRYITGIDRNLTHNDDILSPEFAKDDFKKGWQAHQLCDNIQNEIRKKFLPELISDNHNGFKEEEWVIASAIKIIQDMNDVKCFDLQNYLKYLEYAYNPNGEELEDIKRYNQTMIDLYKGKKETTVEDNCKMWLALGVNAEMGEKIKSKTYEFLDNISMVNRINGIYDEMLRSIDVIY